MLRTAQEIKKEAGEDEFYEKLFAFTENPENQEKLKNKNEVEKFALTLSKEARKYFASLPKTALGESITCESHDGGIFTYTNCPTQPIPNLEKIKTDLCTTHKLKSIKLTGKLVLVGGQLIPEITLHQSSGAENKEIRENLERAFLQDVAKKLIPIYGRVHASVDAQEKFFKYTVDEVVREVKNEEGEIEKVVECKLNLESKDGRMVLSKAAPTFLDTFNEVAVEDFQLADGLNKKSRGFTIEENQQQTKAQELIPDSCLCMLVLVSKEGYPVDWKNSHILKTYQPPLVTSVHDFNTEEVPDHPDVDKRLEINNTAYNKKISGDLAQNGVKGFKSADKLYVPTALDPKTKQKTSALVKAEKACTVRLYQVFVTTIANHEVSNADKIPSYPPLKKGEIGQTNAQWFATFIDELAKAGINNPKEVTFEQMKKHLQSGTTQRLLANQLERLLSTQAINDANCNQNLAKAFDKAATTFVASKERELAETFKLEHLTEDEQKGVLEKCNAPSRTDKRSPFQTFIELETAVQLMGGFPMAHGKTTLTKDQLLDEQENRKVHYLCENTLRGELCYGSTTEASDKETTRPSAKRVLDKTKATLGFCDDLRMCLRQQVTLSDKPNTTFPQKPAVQPNLPNPNDQAPAPASPRVG